MDARQASEHLQVIRTLMENAALYRRALAPVMLAAGGIGVAGATVGKLAHLEKTHHFVLFWLAVAGISLVAAFLLIRRQAFHAGESFWSAPTRRVAHALAPALTVGLIGGLAVTAGGLVAEVDLPVFWMFIYGCALNAAGFFTQRGIRWFGWLFILLGFVLHVVGRRPEGPPPILQDGHLLMGLAFGGLHLAYGAYLYATENRAQPQ